MMAITVDPNTFKVPYAISADGTLYQIMDGRPNTPEILCPICRTGVAFVSESELRAAHFRHKTREECDQLAAYHRQTLHNAVRDAAAALLDTGFGARRICHGGDVLPSGRSVKEDTQTVAGRQHRPDITVYPRDGEPAPILELEVVYSHKPEPERVERAAADGRLIAVLDIAPIEMDYYRKLWAGEAFDIPEACKVYVLDRRFDVMGGADVRRTIRGVLDRRYLPARIRPEDAQQATRLRAPPVQKKGRQLPTAPRTCAICGIADWHVSVKEPDGRFAHVFCLPQFRRAVDRAVDRVDINAPFSAPLPKGGER